jgi:hypothetical protein
MEPTSLETVIERDGEIILTGLPYKRGDRVELTLLSGQTKKRGKLLTARDLLDSPLVGLWKDRPDIGDSLEFARKLREDAQKRRG